jgi:hypothetical protein
VKAGTILWGYLSQRSIPKERPEDFSNKFYWEPRLIENSQDFGLLPARIPACRDGGKNRTEGQDAVPAIE